jgi:hypothetical protein
MPDVRIIPQTFDHLFCDAHGLDLRKLLAELTYSHVLQKINVGTVVKRKSALGLAMMLPDELEHGEFVQV